MRLIWARVAVFTFWRSGNRDERLYCAEERWEAAFCWASVPVAMAARRAVRLDWMSERRFWAARRDCRAIERARLVASREEVAVSAELRREVLGRCSSMSVVIWEQSFSRTESASWMQLSMLERRIRASKLDVGCGVCGVVLTGFEGLRGGSARGRSVKLV